MHRIIGSGVGGNGGDRVGNKICQRRFSVPCWQRPRRGRVSVRGDVILVEQPRTTGEGSESEGQNKGGWRAPRERRVGRGARDIRRQEVQGSIKYILKGK